MGSYWINGGAIAGTLDYYRVVCINDEERGTLFNNRYNWVYHSRSEQMAFSRSHYFEHWSKGTFIDPGGTAATSVLFGQSLIDSGQSYDEWQIAGGTQWKRAQYLYGQIQDSNSNPVAGATIKSYITSTDVVDGSCLSDSQGNYQCPCYTPSVAHYLVAYLVGSPDTATVSANTLIPTN